MGWRSRATALRSLVLVGAVLAFAAGTVGPVAADGPMLGAANGPGADVPYTPAEQAVIASKAQVLAAETARRAQGVSGPMAPDPCLPDSRGNTHCYPYYGTLATNYRHQQYYYYCGPAAVQVVSNYSWGTGTSNKYTQTQISNNWTHTTTAGTTAAYVRVGLNGASVKPGTFVYQNDTLSGTQVSAGAHWNDTVRTDVDSWSMPQVENVAPHNPGWTYFLQSWPNAVSASHYIVVDGWDTIWDGYYSNSSPSVSYDDGSAGYSGKDGHFWDPARTVFYTIWNDFKIIIW